LNEQGTPRRLTVLLGVLVALPALGTDLYVPALPLVARSLAVEVGAAQLTLTTFFIGLAAGMLVWGPLSDRYGRKPVLFAGLATMLAASAAGAVVDSVGAVATARLVQGLAMSSGAVIARTVVRDLHAHEQAARLFAAMTIVFSVVPFAAPMLGALITTLGGWRAIFWCLAAIGALLIFAIIIGLPETAPRERSSAHPGAIARTFGVLLGQRRFVAPFILILCAHLGILAWVSNSAFVLVQGFGVSTAGYGVAFAAVMLGQITGAWASSRFVLRFGIARLLRLGAALMLAAGALLALLAWAGANHWGAVVGPYMLFLFGTALILPNATAAALSPFPASAGAAASLMGAIAFTIGALVSTALGLAFDGTARPMASAALLAGVGAFLLERMLFRGPA
jgi:DHA1 family bicyclomycin/chloramphenicol resistance-like MFS transporter